MHKGKIVELASRDEIYLEPLHPYTKSLLTAIPVPDPEREAVRERVTYDPSIHDYESDLPKMVEIKPGHFIYCNQEELTKYQKELEKR